MLTVCICDDEPVLRRELRNMLQQYSVHQELEIFEISTIPELLGNTSHYDVLFLDIRFDGEDAGVEAAKQLRKKGSDAIIVFLTSLSQYSPNGYEADAFRYLLKPIQMDMLTATMDAACNKLGGKHFRLSVVSDYGTVIIELADISHYDSLPRRCGIYLVNQMMLTWETTAALF
mgnify:CR=1 FL=1